MLNFKHYIPTIVYFGKDQKRFLKKEFNERSIRNVLVVTGCGSVHQNGIFTAVEKELAAANVLYTELSGIKSNPRLSSVYKGIDICKKKKIDFILAVGGGSVIDAAKAIAAGVPYDGDVWDFFEHKAVIKEALPLGVVLTLSATGSEMNGNAVITKLEGKRKLAVGSYLLRPVFSVLDPEYTYTVNAYHTAAGVADIMAHIFEQYFSQTKGADVQNRLAEALLSVCIQYGPLACTSPEHYIARANLMWASSLALNSLIGEGKVQDWATHMIEHELSAVYDISHGIGLAVLYPNWMKQVLSDATVDKFVEYGINVWHLPSDREPMDIAEEAIQKTQTFFASLGLPSRLSELNITDQYFDTMARNALSVYGGTLGSFKELSEEDVRAIYEASL